MKKIILISSIALFINCKPQKNDGNTPISSISASDTDNNEKKLKIDSQTSTDKKNNIVEESNHKKEYNSMIVKYQENFIVSKEDLEKIPLEYREQILNTFSKPIFYNLTTNNKQSSYQSTSEESNIYNSSDPGRTNETSIILPILNVYKDFENLELIKQDQLIEKTYLITDKLNKINWTITNEKENINKFVCKKATAIVNNKKVTAYYTDEIAINDGPSIFYGLPGLILKVETAERTYTVLQINFKKSLEIKKFKKGSIISPKEFEEITKKMKENPTTTTHNEVRN